MEPLLNNNKNNNNFSEINERSITELENFLHDHIYKSGQTHAMANSIGSLRAHKRTVLLIDDDGGDSYEVYYEDALEMANLTYASYNRLTSGRLDESLIDEHGIIVWFTGDQRDSTLTPSDQEWLGAFLEGGGNLFLTGQNIAYDLQSSPFLISSRPRHP